MSRQHDRVRASASPHGLVPNLRVLVDATTHCVAAHDLERSSKSASGSTVLRTCSSWMVRQLCVPRSLLGEKIIAFLEVYVDDDLSLASMPLVDGKLSSTQNKLTCALSSTATYGAEQESSLVKLSFPIHTLPIPASIFCGFGFRALRHIEVMFCVNLLSSAPSVR